LLAIAGLCLRITSGCGLRAAPQQDAADSGCRRPGVGDEDRATGAEDPEHLTDRLGAKRFGQVMDRQAADHDVVGAVRSVEGFGEPVRVIPKNRLS
jgi:hypothetical protein